MCTQILSGQDNASHAATSFPKKAGVILKKAKPQGSVNIITNEPSYVIFSFRIFNPRPHHIFNAVCQPLEETHEEIILWCLQG